MKKFLGILGTFTLAFSGLATVACSFGVKEIESTATIMKKNIEIASYVAKGAILSQQEGWDSTWTNNRMSTLNVKEELGKDFISKPNEDAPDENYVIKDLYNMTFGTTNPKLLNEDKLNKDLSETPTGRPEYTQPWTDQYKNTLNLVGTAKEFLVNGLQAGQLDAILGVLGSQLSGLGIEETIASIGKAIDDNAKTINTISEALKFIGNRKLADDITVDGLVKNDIDAIIKSIRNVSANLNELILNIVIALIDIVELSTAFQKYDGDFDTFIHSKTTDVNADGLAGTINLTNLFETLFLLFTDPKDGNNTKFFEFITGYLSLVLNEFEIFINNNPEKIAPIVELVNKFVIEKIASLLTKGFKLKIPVLGEIEILLLDGEIIIRKLTFPKITITVEKLWVSVQNFIKSIVNNLIFNIPNLLQVFIDLFENNEEQFSLSLNKFLKSFNSPQIVEALKSVLDCKITFITIRELLAQLIGVSFEELSNLFAYLTSGNVNFYLGEFNFKTSLYNGDIINDTIRTLLITTIANLTDPTNKKVVISIFNLLNTFGITSEPINDYSQVKEEINKIKINHPIPNLKTISETNIPFIKLRVIDLLDILKQISKDRDGKDVVYDMSKISVLLDSLITKVIITATDSESKTGTPISLLSQIISDTNDYKNIEVSYQKYSENINNIEENEIKVSASTLLHATLGLVKKQNSVGVEFHKDGLLYGLSQILGGKDSEINKLAINKLLNNGYEYINGLVDQEEKKEKEYFKPYYESNAWSIEIIKNEDPLIKQNEFILTRTHLTNSNMTKKFKFKLEQVNNKFELTYISLV